MTDIEKKAYEKYPEIKKEDYPRKDFIRVKVRRDELRQAYIKCAEEYESLPKIHGWVARDSVEDAFIGTGLILHHSKPTRTGGEWSSLTIAMHLPSKMFPEITWESEPVEVELLIRKVESTKQV